MRLFALALPVAAAVARVTAAAPPMDGWFPCAGSTFADENPTTSGSDASSSLFADCATFKAPLCHDGVCNDTNKTQIDIFVKRITAAKPNQPNIIFMQGGPGAASPAMESALTGIFTLLNGNVNVYTMDHRGTGRSTMLDCVAAQGRTSGSPGGASIDATEVASCAADLESKYGTDLSAFSITSAASDLKLFISNFLAGESTFVYGVSYGTSLVERLMHLNTTGIAGYVLDGISTTSGSDVKNFEYFSKWDVDYDEVAQHFLSFCANDANCGKYFKDTTVSDALRALTNAIDSPAAKCSKVADVLLAQTFGYSPGTRLPSQSLRMFMGGLLGEASLRKFIPVVTYRLTRCNDDDVDVLDHFSKRYSEYLNKPSSDDYSSDLVYKLIVFSEFWETPTPSLETMTARYLNTTVSSGSFDKVQSYCAFSKEKSPGCASFANDTHYTASPLIYKRDKYWNVAAKPPTNVSVLIMSSKMDPQTPHKYAEYLLDALDTKNKELITFEQATHGTLWSTPLSNTDPNAPVCGMMLVASYLSVGGELAKMDKSCVAKMPTVSFAVSDKFTKNWLNTTAAMDGPFMGKADEGESAPKSSSTTSYKTAFIVVLVLFIIVLLAAIAFLVQWRKSKKHNTESVYHETEA